MDIPPSFWACCVPRETQIMMAEMLAPVIAIRSHPDMFRGRAATYFIDNVAVVSALVCGASRAPDLSRMGFALSAISHSLGCPYWIDWVPSASNIADDGSRRGSSETAARELGIDVSPAVFPAAALSDILRSTPAQIVRHFLW